MIGFTTIPPRKGIKRNIYFPRQIHSSRVLELKTGDEIVECDGVFTKNRNLILGIKTADCAPVVFMSEEMFAIVHAGWRGLVDGILENMMQEFSGEKRKFVWIGPLNPIFEIQKDECYQRIFYRFKEQFFSEQKGKIFFSFADALLSVLPKNAYYCGESTFTNTTWASRRRQKGCLYEQNITVVGHF
jgi:copper oxidase (laccase) domain-containing protein